jgi:hypothetical protein
MRDTLILVEVNPGLTSGFVYSPFIVVPGTTITLSSLASGNTSLQWSVNHVTSGNTDTLVFTVDPNYLEDTISITCTTQNVYGCIDTSETFIVIENQVLDLAVSDVFISNQGKESVIGVALKNEGTLPIDTCSLTLGITGIPWITNTVLETIVPGDTYYYVFPSTFDLSALSENLLGDLICVEGRAYPYGSIEEVHLSNNEACRLLEDQTYEVIPIHPNPVNDGIDLGIMVSKDLSLTATLYNAMGQKIKVIADHQLLSQGLQYLTIPCKDLGYGIYWIYISDGNSERVLKFLKSN